MNGALLAPQARLAVGITGHRTANAAFAANRDAIAAAIEAVFAAIDRALAAEGPTPVRLHSLLADGADQLAAEAGLARGWELVAPLPFGHALNVAINAHPGTADEARRLLDGREPEDPALRARAAELRGHYARAHLFELADADAEIAALYLAKLSAPGDMAAAQRYAVHASERVALAGRVLIEQSDLVIAVWDGASRAFVGGTGHTVTAALELGAPVVLIDANAPADWCVRRTLESLVHPHGGQAENREALLAGLVRKALHPAGDGSVRAALAALSEQTWRRRSNPLFHGYRRIEALFGGGPGRLGSLRQTYETPQAITAGSGAPMLARIGALPGADPAFAETIAAQVLRRFAWADGISTHLSDLYRGGMVASFLASGLAVVSGLAYLPTGGSGPKWIFALVEFALLVSILLVTAVGRRGRWHARWFETRRVSEYLRHSPVLLVLGAARPPGRWPRGTDTSWPEYYASQSLREVGLPRAAISQAYLRGALHGLIDSHVVSQRDYHRAKAQRLSRVHRNLDRLSVLLFQLAVASVAVYLALVGGAALNLIADEVPDHLSKLFTFLGVQFPTFGGTIAGIRYFGDFDRFAAISQVSAEKLDSVHRRAELLLAAPASALDYGSVADLAKAADEVVVAEIENWQAVFGGKHITVPV